MDLESVFDGPLSTGSLGEKSGKGVSVWQAEVALRLSKSDSHRKEGCSKTTPSSYPVVRYIFAIATPISFPMCCCCVTKSWVHDAWLDHVAVPVLFGSTWEGLGMPWNCTLAIDHEVVSFPNHFFTTQGKIGLVNGLFRFRSLRLQKLWRHAYRN